MTIARQTVAKRRRENFKLIYFFNKCLNLTET